MRYFDIIIKCLACHKMSILLYFCDIHLNCNFYQYFFRIIIFFLLVRSCGNNLPKQQKNEELPT